MTTKPTRERSCIGCGTKAPKGGLWRIVRAPDGTVAFDAAGRANGRGAYVCSRECFDAAWRSGRLERALKAKVEGAVGDRIASELSSAVREAQK